MSSVKAALGAVRDFIGGHQEDEEDVSENLAVRSSAEPIPPPQPTTQEVKMETDNQSDKNAAPREPEAKTVEQGIAEQKSAPGTEQSSREFAPSEDFDQAVRDLRAGESAETRAAAARILAGAGRQRATPHLIAALFDADATVRATANEVLEQLGNSSVPNNAAAQGFAKAPAVKPASLEQSQAPAETAKANHAPSVITQPDKPTEIVSAAVAAPESGTGKDPQQLLAEENQVRTRLQELESQILETIAARKDAEKEIRRHIESEARLRTEAAARR